MTKSFSPNRRETMLGLLAVASAGMAACKEKQPDVYTMDGVAEHKLGEPFLGGKEMALLSALAGTIIPKTDTPGAVEAGVPETIQDLLSNWSDGDVRTYWRTGLKSFTDYFANDGSSVFADMSAEDQFSVLSKLDKGVFAGSIDLPIYRDFKQAIAGAYYMSEAGATQELAYDPVPGDFKGCIDFSEVGKAWAT